MNHIKSYKVFEYNSSKNLIEDLKDIFVELTDNGCKLKIDKSERSDRVYLAIGFHKNTNKELSNDVFDRLDSYCKLNDYKLKREKEDVLRYHPDDNFFRNIYLDIGGRDIKNTALFSIYKDDQLNMDFNYLRFRSLENNKEIESDILNIDLSKIFKSYKCNNVDRIEDFEITLNDIDLSDFSDLYYINKYIIIICDIFGNYHEPGLFTITAKPLVRTYLISISGKKMLDINLTDKSYERGYSKNTIVISFKLR